MSPKKATVSAPQLGQGPLRISESWMSRLVKAVPNANDAGTTSRPTATALNGDGKPPKSVNRSACRGGAGRA